jgi:hypothetical protein
MTKNVFIVKCDRDVFEKNFSKKRNSDVINHHEIREKLTNNDLYKTPPSPEIIQYQIMKKINSFTRCKKSEFIYLYREEITREFVEGVKTLFTTSDFQINFHLVIDRNIEVEESLFCTIQVIDYENDKD